MSSSTVTPRKTRTFNTPSKSLDKSAILDDLKKHLHSPTDFIQLCNQYSQSQIQRSAWLQMIGRILIIENVDKKILLFILECLIENHDHLSETQFKQNLLPFIKEILITNDEKKDLLLSALRCLIVLVEYRPNILTLTFAEWLSCLLNFLVTNLSATTSLIYGDLIIELLTKIVKQFTPLSKEIVDILGRTSPTAIITTGFLNQLKLWIENTDDTRLALFAIHLWESLAALLSRLLLRGHSKGNEILAVIEDAFLVSNYSIRSAAFTAWSFFISHIHQTDDIDPQQLNNRLLKLFLTPFLSDSTSKSKSASISKCHAWLTLISLYPKNISDVILPFLSFAFGNHDSSKTISTTTAWWTECRQIGGQFLHDLLLKNSHAEYSIQLAGDEILNYLFDSIVDQLLEYSINQVDSERDSSLWLSSWNAYLNHLIRIFQSNHVITEQQRVAINTCLLTRIEQLWIDSRIETRFLLKLFETFEQIGFPLAIETVLCDSSTRTKTLSAAQIHPSSGNHKSQDKHLSYRTTLSDQYLHMMLEHAIRLNDEDQTNEEAYLHVISYLIDTLSKTSEENFCYQTNSLLLKCAVEFSHQPLTIPSLFWHIWSRCSTHLIQILNRSHTFELHDQIDNQKQETSIELLLRPFASTDIQRLDYSYTLLWTQLFKALCRLALIHNEQSKHVLVHLLVEILRNEPAFEQAINDQHNQRLFGLILISMKTILKTFADIDLSVSTDRSTHHFVQLFSNTQKRSQPSSSIILCLTQLTIIINHILQRLLSNNENNTQYALVCSCLLKSNKLSSAEQTKSLVFTYIRDLLVDLFNLCKIYSHLEIVVSNLTHLIPFLYLYEPTSNTNGSSPISIQKQQIDNVILNKILSIISTVFELSNGSSVLQLIHPLLILAFQHQKTLMRNRARKCWNETFGRMTFIVYPNELRMCLRDLKDKEHLLLPCFLADHDNSNTAGSGAPPSSTDESQLSQQIDIATPLIRPTKLVSSPARFTPSVRSTNMEKNEPVFVPIVNNINHNNQADSPVMIGKRLSSSINSCLTEKQKEKLRTRQIIPLLCDDNSDTQSNSCTVDTPLIESMMSKHQLRSNNSGNKQLTATGLCLFKQPSSNPPGDKNTTVEEASKTNDISIEEIENHQEDISEESSIAKKLRRSCRPSISARKSLTNKTKKIPPIPFSDDINSSVLPDPHVEQVKKPSIKGILKRLSPTKPRHEHTRRVVFHDQVKVLVFPSPLRRDSSLPQQQRKKSPYKDETNSPSRIIPKENLPLRKQPMSARRLSAMQNTEPIVATPPVPANKIRSSKLFHPNDALADWTQSHGVPPESNNEQQSSETPSSKLDVTSETNVNDHTKEHDKLYDVDTLMDSLDYEKLDLNDKTPSSTRQTDSADEPELMSPLTRCLSPMLDDMDRAQMLPENAGLSNGTLGDRLQKAADIYRSKGTLPFDDDYIELVRQLFNNSSLTSHEQLRLKSVFLDC